MIHRPPDGKEAMASGESPRWLQFGVIAAACALVIGLYAYIAQPGVLDLLRVDSADAYYNLLVRGFRAGQLSLKKEVPPGLAQLADPYDPAANAPYRAPPYRMLDLSYYKGNLYLYFGVTPALILFWPFVALTGRYLLHQQAVVIFCSVGFLASVALLCILWRRHFKTASLLVVAACALALGLATGVPIMLSRADVYEVSISCGYMLTMLTLGAIWLVLHDPKRNGWWLVTASLAFGLAVGARPSLLGGAVVLLVPVAQAWRARRKLWAPLMAVTAPLVLIGLALMLYNALRFDNPFEFGIRYQLAGDQQLTRPLFNPRWLWFNFRIYFLAPARWMCRWPFVREIAVPTLPAGYVRTEAPFGILPNIPLVWLALALPLAWREQSAEAGTILRWFVIAVALLFGACALTMSLFSAGCIRYEVEFLPALVLMAVIGVLTLECALTPGSESGRACRLAWRRTARWFWGLLLGFSVVFNLLASVLTRADGQYWLGVLLAQGGQTREAVQIYDEVLRIRPDFAEAHFNLGVALEQTGRAEEAREHYERALRIKPDYANPQSNLGDSLLRAGRASEAIAYYEQALRLKPDSAETHYNLGVALQRSGKLHEAMGQYRKALDLGPTNAEAQNNLGTSLAEAGRISDAVSHYEEALRIKPDFAEAHYNLGIALEKNGRLSDAMTHYEQALRIRPDFVNAQNRLARLRAIQ